MSVSLYRWTAECDIDFCPGDCDLCEKNKEEEDEILRSDNSQV